MVTIPCRGADSLAYIGEPFFERDYTRFCGHSYTPEESVTEYAAVVRNKRIITFSFPLFETYGKYGAPILRSLLGNCIRELITPIVQDGGPTNLEASVVSTEAGLVVHLLCFCAERRAEGLDIVEDAMPIVDMPISVQVTFRPARVFLAPGDQPLDFEYKDGRVHTRVSFTGGHAMLVLER